MSVIAVEGFPLKVNLSQVVYLLAKGVQGDFEALNFVHSDRSPFKTCYLKLSNKLNPEEAVKRINRMNLGKKKNVLNAYVPDTVPNLPIAAKRAALPKNLRKKLGIVGDVPLAEVVSAAHWEIMSELQYKYPGLYKLSSGGSHTLLEAIGMTVQDRLWHLAASAEEGSRNSFTLTGRYRKAHPHFGDFQLILGTLHRLQDAAGAQRTQLLEAELAATPTDMSVIDNIPYAKAHEAVSKYTKRITKKLAEHIRSYDLRASPEDSKEEVARKEVQAQLAKLKPYLPLMMKQIVVNHFAEDSQDNKFQRMRLYGEPYLPGKEFTSPLMKRFRAMNVARWKAMFNLLVFDVPIDNYSKIMAMDGTTLGASKIVIRSSDAKIYHVSPTRTTATKLATESAALEDEEEAAYNMEQ